MDLSVEEFVDRVLSDEAYQEPSNSVKLEELDEQMRLPEWFDEKKFNQGKRFFWDFCYGFLMANVVSLFTIYSIPTIVNVLSGSRRANSPYTSYKRYLSTFLHYLSWFKCELKPGTVAWKSLQTVRSRHLKADRAAKLKGQGTISQRDMSLTLFANIGPVILKPDKFSIHQIEDGDWEALIHTWRVFGYMLGLQDRYNICRESFEETRQVCQRIKERVQTPCLENVPEYFEHSVHVTIDGLGAVVSGLEKTFFLYFSKYIADVPGYIYTESDRIALQDKLRKHLLGKSLDTGVESTALVEKSALEGLPKIPPRVLYFGDYNSVENSPAYKALPFIAKYKLALFNITFSFYSTKIGRILLNRYIRWILFVAENFPFVAMWRFGIKNAFVNIFKEDPVDNTVPKPNSEYYKPKAPEPWYKSFAAILW